MKIAIIVLLVVSIAGCYYDNDEELYGPCVIEAAAVRYSATVAPLLNSYGCIGCHSGASPSGSLDLTQYVVIRSLADNGKLYGAISHSSGFKPMPDGARKMNACDISKVKAWIDAGAPNN